MTLRDREDKALFPGTNWVWHPGEQWAALGANGSGKNYFANGLALGIAPKGHIYLHLPPSPREIDIPQLVNRRTVAVVSPELHRRVLLSECSFYQARWHNGLEEGSLTGKLFLSRECVEDISPFEVGKRGADPALFEARKQMFLKWMEIPAELLSRKWMQLSNGEQRKLLIINALLHNPRLLALVEPFGGLDVQTRAILKTIISRLMQLGMPVFVLVSRPDELPEGATHLLLMEKDRILQAGPKEVVLQHSVAQQLAGSVEPVTPRIQPSPRAIEIRQEPIPSGTEPIVELKDVTFRVEDKLILDHINWTIYPGENWALLGPNGSGKTSLLSLIQGDHPLAYSLNIRVLGKLYRSTRELWKIRQQMGWLSLELHLLYPGERTCENVICSGFSHSMGLYTPPNAEQREEAQSMIKLLGLLHIASQLFEDVSEGDQRMVLLARAMVHHPRLLMIDEGCQGLDADYRQRLLDTVDWGVKTLGTTLIFVTHYEEEIPDCIHHRLRLKEGRVVK